VTGVQTCALPIWEIDGIAQQRKFFFDKIPKSVSKDLNVIIISDALRYEIAKELQSNLINGGFKSSNMTLTAMQSSIPSITELGMAAMLNHSDQLSIKDDGAVYIKGINSNGLGNRNRILQGEKAMDSGRVAYTFDSIIDLPMKEFQKKFKEMSTVYIYHNVIDARGDHAPSEKEVFNAVEKTLSDLEKLTKKLNPKKGFKKVKNIYITADHGFLYQDFPISEADKLLRDKSDAIKAKHRYMLNSEPKNNEGTLTFDISRVAGTTMYATVPKGTMRFKSQGGGFNYVHGGAMPQEFIVPLLHYKAEETIDVETVGVICTAITKKITTHEVTLRLMQTQSVADGLVAAMVKLYFEDEQGNLISNETKFIANDTTGKIDNRTYHEKLVIMNKDFYKEEPINLIVENDESGEEMHRLTFYLDL
jgi:uncharacterized protein (TIGR02687 family)